jgi:hypothetical protein
MRDNADNQFLDDSCNVPNDQNRLEDYDRQILRVIVSAQVECKKSVNQIHQPFPQSESEFPRRDVSHFYSFLPSSCQKYVRNMRILRGQLWFHKFHDDELSVDEVACSAHGLHRHCQRETPRPLSLVYRGGFDRTE